jgi:DHA3 family macrolide efflux protein-like MFS transporter
MKNKKAITLLLIANAVSSFAQGISMLAIPWTLVNARREEAFFGSAVLIITILSLFWSPYAGTLIDRYPRKNIFFGLCIVGFVLLGFSGIYGLTTGFVPSILCVVVFAFTMLNFNLHYPTLYSFTQEMADRSNYSKVNSLLEIQGQSTNILSGAFGTVLLSGLTPDSLSWLGVSLPFTLNPWTIEEIFIMDAVTYAVSFALIAAIRYKRIAELKVDAGSLRERFIQGVSYLKQHKPIFYFGSFSYLVFVFVLIHEYYLVHLYVSNNLMGGGHILAISLVSFTSGALTAGFSARYILKYTTAIYGVSVFMLIAATVAYSMAFTVNAAPFFLLSFILGLTNSSVRIMRVTFLFENIPNNTIGRTTSIFQMFNISSRIILVSLFALPFFVEDVTRAYLICGSVIALGAIPIFLLRKKFTA